MTAMVSSRVLPPTAATIGLSRNRPRGTGPWKRCTQDMQRQARMIELYRLQIGEAKAGDAAEAEVQPSTTYLDARL